MVDKEGSIEFDVERTELLRSRSETLFSVGAAFAFAFLALDWFVARDIFTTALIVRCLCAVVLLAGAFLMRKIDTLSGVVALILTVSSLGILSVDILCALLGGFASLYFPGVLMVVFMVSASLPLTYRENLIFSGMSLVAWFAPNILLVEETNLTAAAISGAVLLGAHMSGLSVTVQAVGQMRKNFDQRSEIEEARERERKIGDSKERFFANVTHELRTPLTLILATVGQLRPELGATPSLDTLEVSAATLLRQVNQLLDVAKSEAGQLKLTLSEDNIGASILALIRAAEPLTANAGVKLREEGAAEIENTFFDAAKIEIVLSNLLSNAVKYTPRGGRVTVRTRRDDDQIRVEIEDTGVGIPDSRLGRVFDRFYQASEADNQQLGTGLGLSLVRDFVDLHGGKVGVTSQQGEGSTFWFTIPQRPESKIDRRQRPRRQQDRIANYVHEAAARAAEDRAHSQNVLFSDLRKSKARLQHRNGEWKGKKNAAKVLIVEDNPDIAVLNAATLAHRYCVATAPDGLAGLELAKRSRPDVIVTDVNMPKLDGISMVDELRRDPLFERTAVIMLTADVVSGNAVRALEAGADDYIRKPFEPRELVARVDAQLRIRSAEARVDEQQARFAAIGSLASTIVHDARNTMASVLSRADLMRLRGPESATTSDLESVSSASWRATAMLQEILDFARGGAVTLKANAVDLAALIDHVDELARPGFRFSSIELIPTKDFEAGFECWWDENRITRILENLLTNAKSALLESGTPEPRVWLGAQVVGDRVRLTVEDNGPGIPDEIAESLFDPTVSGFSGGTGLGLANVRNLVVAHGGEVSVMAKGQHGGALFAVTLPQRLGNGAEPAEDALTTNERPMEAMQ